MATRKVPHPSSFVRTSWSQDQWTLGSYSYIPTGACPKDRVASRKSLGNRVFFGGEHTCSEAPSTVHGAALSGHRAAAELLEVAQPGESIVVVGAGMAGLSAARVLQEADYEVCLLEARERIGGRIDTVCVEGFEQAVERGANWVQAADELQGELTQLGTATIPFDWGCSAVLGPEGRCDIDAIEKIGERAVERAEAYAEKQNNDLSLAQALQKSGAWKSKKNELALDTYLFNDRTLEYGASAEEMSAWWGDDEGMDGDDHLVLGGYASVAESAAKGLHIRTNSAVSTITWSRKGVSLEMEDQEQPIRADRVIVTVPLGVLKAGRPAFHPPLPPKQYHALQRLRMGTLDKLWLRFETQFWTETSLTWLRLGEKDPQLAWFNMAPLTGEPVLMALLGGEEARKWAHRTDEELLCAAVESLQAYMDAGW